MILHLQDAVNVGYNVILRTVDTDVVILAVAAIVEIDIQELWVAFGTGRHFRYIPNWPWQVSISSYHVYGVWYGIIFWHKGK